MKTDVTLIVEALSLFVGLPTLILLAFSYWRDKQDKKVVAKPKAGNYFKTKK